MILVTGGTGLVGAHLLCELTKNERHVRALYRTKERIEKTKEVFVTQDNVDGFSRIEWVAGDINDVPSLELAFTGITHVYHVAAKVSFDTNAYQSLLKVNIEGTANIVNMAIEYQVQKICYVSSVATLSPKVGQELMDETCEWNPEESHSDYGISKNGAEQEIWRATQEGVDVVIVNPGVIFGSGFWQENTGRLISKIIKGMPFYTLGSVGVVWVSDVVTAMVQLMNSDIKNRRYVLVSENISYKDLFAKIAKAFKVKPPRIPVGVKPMLLLSYLSYIFSLLSFGIVKPLSVTTVKSSQKRLSYDGSLITKDLEYSYTSTEIVLESIEKDYKKRSL